MRGLPSWHLRAHTDCRKAFPLPGRCSRCAVAGVFSSPFAVPYLPFQGGSVVRKTVFFAIASVLVLAVAFVTVHAADQTMPTVGQVAPTFTLPSQDGFEISLNSFKGKWVVLYFYPKDMTS